jgi:hypothetical protein
MPPNGLAQRQRRDWRESFLIMAHFWQIAPARSGRAAVRWSQCKAAIHWDLQLEIGLFFPLIRLILPHGIRLYPYCCTVGQVTRLVAIEVETNNRIST